MKNKQLDSQIKSDTPADEKTALNDEKDKNNDELRKLRTQRFQKTCIFNDLRALNHFC